MIKKLINKLGYDIHKIKNSDKKLYKNIFSKESLKQKCFYNIGAGNFYHPYWTNIDFKSKWYKNNKKAIQYNLLSAYPIPVGSSSAELIYSSHTIEHITNEAAQKMFNEAYRMLKINGVFRIVAPDVDLSYEAYKRNDRSFFYWIDWYRKSRKYKKVALNAPLNKASIEQLFLYRFASSLSTLHSDGAEERFNDNKVKEIFSEMKYEDALNFCISKCPLYIQEKYPGNHVNWWNKEKATKMLALAGFKKIYTSGYGQSLSPVLRNTLYFDNTHPKISLFIEVIKE